MNFNQYETRERKALKHIESLNMIKINYLSPIESKERNDGIITLNISGMTDLSMVEVKVRQFDSDKYDSSYLSFDKYVGLIRKHKDELQISAPDSKLLYFAFHPSDRTAFVYDLYNTPFTITPNVGHKKTTAINGSDDYVYEHMVTYETKNAILKLKY